MKKIFTMVVLSLAMLGSVYAYDDGDFQVWNTDVEELKIGDNSKIALEEEFRWGDNANEFFYQHYDLGLFYDLKKYLNIGCGYRQVYELKKGKFKLENEPYVTATLSWVLLGFKIDDRNRFEYQHFDYQDDTWRYRNKINLRAPFKFTSLGIQPFASEEIFLRFDDSTNLSQNRVSCGLGMDFNKNVKAEVYYMFVSTKGAASKWKDTNVLGTKLKIAF